MEELGDEVWNHKGRQSVRKNSTLPARERGWPKKQCCGEPSRGCKISSALGSSWQCAGPCMHFFRAHRMRANKGDIAPVQRRTLHDPPDSPRSPSPSTGGEIGLFKDVRFIPMLNFGHFWAPLFSRCFYPTMNSGHFWAPPRF